MIKEVSKRRNDSYKIDWGDIIVDIVKKKDLDSGDFSDCWDEEYDWTELDNFVILNFEDDCIGYAEVAISQGRPELKGWTTEDIRADLRKYQKEVTQ